jgi:dolichyl-phosphate-mannose-protein mannosyltransferase
MPLALAIGLCVASGYLIVKLTWPTGSASSDRLLCFSLSIGFGLGFFSSTFFVSRALNLEHLKLQHILTIDALCFALLFGSYFLRRRYGKAIDFPRPSNRDLELPSGLHLFLITAFVATLAAAFYSSVKLAIAHPHGEGWDAFSIWNLHARFLFLGGTHWRDGLSPLIPWSHPDYPLLLPGAIAHFWVYLGNDSSAVPAAIGLAFTFSTLGLLYGSLERARGRTAAILGLMTLASTPFFIEQGSAQYADVPLSFFFLASIASLSMYHQLPSNEARDRGLIVLAGLALGCAAWTKNEGVLFLFATIVASLLVFVRGKRQGMAASELQPISSSWSLLVTLVLAAAPIFGLVLWLKHAAPRGDLFQGPAIMLQKMLTPARYWAILKWYVRQLFRFGEWWPVPATVLLPALYVVLSDKQIAPKPKSRSIALWTLGLTLAGYFAIYVITPNELYWHLRFSLNRLFLQLWPSVIFLFFSSVSFRSFNNVSK